jgi:DNA-directed RNA polymerase specialized sigma24 family protein
VKQEHSPPAAGAASFHTTHWTIVAMAAKSQARGGQAGLAELCQLYWYPLYVFARSHGHSPDDAEDLTQGFFLHLLEHRALAHVDRLKGKFRSFLLASFQNYLSVEAHRARCLRRGGNCKFVTLDLEKAEDSYLLEQAIALTPEQIFDARWAMTLLGRTMTLLREEYAAQDKTSTFEMLKAFLDISKAPPPYEQAADALQVSVASVKTLIHRLRKRFASILREQVGRTVSDPVEVDGEIHALCDALIAAQGRLVPVPIESTARVFPQEAAGLAELTPEEAQPGVARLARFAR